MTAHLTPEGRRAAQVLWDFHTAPDRAGDASGADILLALGSHDLRVAGYAARAWERGVAPLVVFSGDRGRHTSGQTGPARWERPEAEEFAAVARRETAIPDSAMLLERRATNTAENFAFSRLLVDGHGIAVRRAVVTAKPYMGQRALATAAVHWPGVHWSFRCFPGGLAGYHDDDRYPEAEVLHFLVGDLQRLVLYAERGWSAPVPVPDRVREAHDLLVRLGFTRHAVVAGPLRG
ncbi:YdcF family protein [Marinactinospora thermotolerans]|uniref:Uncharacterized conserved protein n=1 Tax=Marinactinospora thermotolerans DSM 45154 TaxID=1122192 RepID=A0A1T4KUH6_9ACTN|nr:YdcF family protein [Marinactinospora thermotolerans]SJZ45998.1 Uncharacterized conserved protein [Marinactinospora thermotolerans DSM 45154]